MFPTHLPFLFSLALTALHRTPPFPKQIFYGEENPIKEINVMEYWFHIN